MAKETRLKNPTEGNPPHSETIQMTIKQLSVLGSPSSCLFRLSFLENWLHRFKSCLLQQQRASMFHVLQDGPSSIYAHLFFRWDRRLSSGFCLPSDPTANNHRSGWILNGAISFFLLIPSRPIRSPKGFRSSPLKWDFTDLRKALPDSRNQTFQMS